jgi:fermentation-respiration switch protein FrsA (DUF1100 family)
MKFFVTFIVLFFLASTIFLYLYQRNMIYFPLREEIKRANYNAQDMQLIQLHTEDGLILNAWYKPAQSSKPTLLFLHGNAGHIGYRMVLVRRLLDSGLGVLLLEYRGYANNPGKPSENGLYADARAALNYLIKQGVSSNDVVILGQSLGTGVATKMALEFSVCAVILQSPFTSMAKVAKYHYPWVLLSPWDKYDSLTRIDKIKTPLLILHGQQDRIVPITHSQELYQKATSQKQLKIYPERGHNDMWTEEYVADLLAFIFKNCN